MRAFWLLCLILSATVSTTVVGSVTTSPPVISHYVPNAKVVGKARYTYLFWDIYDATLYAPEGSWQASQPFALELIYLRDFDGKDIAKRSVAEMRKQGLKDSQQLQEWETLMASIFPDVKPQTRLTGIADNSGSTHFYAGDEAIGEINDPEFTRWFFNIWLGSASSETKIRDQLLDKEAS